MTEFLVDRHGLGSGGDAVPSADIAAGSTRARNWETIAWVGGGTALVSTILGLSLGYAAFHSSGKLAANEQVGRPGGRNVNDVIPDAQKMTVPAQQQQLAGMLGGPAAPGTAPGSAGTSRDVNGNPLPANQAAMQGTNAGGATPANARADQARTMGEAARRSPIMAFAINSGPLGGDTAAPAAAAPETALAAAGPDGEDPASPPTVRNNRFRFTGQHGEGDARSRGEVGPSDFSGQLAHAAIQTVRATLVSNRSFLLSAGTLIPCSLQTAINSTQAGYVSCVINHDVYSEDGRIVLLDKGTKVLGQYSGGLQQGQARLFVVWTRALTPRGVAIDLGSPAADELGRSGMAGGVDTQFWQRFGGALMLSVIEDAANIAGRAVAGYGTNTTEVPSQTAGVALQNSINIRPILRKNQGDDASIFVAKDFDFSPVYNVRMRR